MQPSDQGAQVKRPSESPPASPVNQRHWWFPGVTHPDSGGPVCPSHLNSFSGTGFPQVVLTLTQKPLSSRQRTPSVPGDSDLCQYPLHLRGMTRLATFICFHCPWILTKPGEVSAIVSPGLRRTQNRLGDLPKPAKLVRRKC